MSLVVCFSNLVCHRFVRQLNIYGFRKVESRDGVAFVHPCFRADSPNLLKHIQRRKPGSGKKALSALAAQQCYSSLPSASVPQSFMQPVPQSSSPVPLVSSESSEPPTDNASLYKLLIAEIGRLQQQNGDTQNTIRQLKEVILLGFLF